MGRIVAIVGALALAIGLFTMAPSSPVVAQAGSGSGTGTGTGTGTGQVGDCSPGYFKNHLDEWQGMNCGFFCGGYSDGALYAMLTATGAHNGELKQAAGDCLNMCTGCTE